MLRHVRYIGRRGSEDGLTDTATGAEVHESVRRADIVTIDDPLSFPWEFIDGSTAKAARAVFVVDISACSPDQLAALRPALVGVGPHDSIVHRTNPDNHQSVRFAQQLGARTTEPRSDELDKLCQAKQLDHAENLIIDRLRREWQTLVVDLDDLDDLMVDETADRTETDWANATWADPSDSRPAALVVRVPGDEVRAERTFSELATTLMERVAGAAVVDVQGVRTGPGAPLARGVIAIRVDR